MVTPSHRTNIQKSLVDDEKFTTVDSLVDMSWYNAWLTQQLKNLPYCLRDLRVEGNLLLEKSCLAELFQATQSVTQENEGISIDEIVEYLQENGTLENMEELLGPQRLLIFAVLGWQTMLYQPAFNVCSIQQLAIHQDSSQPQSGLIFDNYKVSADISDRPLWILLKAFGNILPARSPGVARASETSKVASSWLPLYPMETNAYLLHNLLGVRIRWVDALALHLDYDKSSRTLSLFSYPSFCLDMLLSDGLIYSFACSAQCGMDLRANRDDISQLLREVLLSYRLLFGQSAKSRKLFRQIFKPSENHHVDSLLPLLCTKKRLPSGSTTIPADRPVYFAARDFPILYARVELIAKELKDSRPNSIGNLLRDRRDTLQFWTFWLVTVFGGISIILSLMQVILQAVQLMQG